ncbi:MAG: hypothetical protein ACUVUF_04695 [Candidatus Bathycorpusculaceae bacterium]
MHTDYKGITATHKELREAGYFYKAKLIVLRDMQFQKKGLRTTQKEEATHS